MGIQIPANLFAYDGVIYFSAIDGVNGRELWQTDGTNSGTELVLDLSEGKLDSSPTNFVEFKGNLYFSAFSTSVGREIHYLRSDDFGYETYSVASQFEDISGTGASILAGENDASHLLSTSDLGDFSFKFMGVEYESIYVSSNGLVSFGGVVESGDNSLFNSTDVALIAPFWDDLTLNSGGDVFWEVRGTGINERLIIQWNEVDHVGTEGSGDTATFQLVLSEFDSTTQINYLDVTFGDSDYDNGESATIGVRSDGNGDYVHVASLDSSSGVAGDNQSIRNGRFTGENEFGHNAWIQDSSWENIGTANSVLSGEDDAFVELTDSDLGDFKFNFFDSTYSNLFVSTNGLITFGNGSTKTNDSTDFSEFEEAAIAAFWDDFES